eukprot:GFUD01016512.1.p1 GENE.GFUD01016512.1~~GFUD01016512.1.p1  ORF type:complete len:366 (+),score=134.44 GFUD01016512.1:86-1183(+)
MFRNPEYTSENEDKKPNVSEIFTQYRVERKRKAKTNKNEPKIKIERINDDNEFINLKIKTENMSDDDDDDDVSEEKSDGNITDNNQGTEKNTNNLINQNIFNWKYFLTSAPLEEEEKENPPLKDHLNLAQNIKLEEELKRLKEEDTNKYIDVPMEIKMEQDNKSKKEFDPFKIIKRKRTEISSTDSPAKPDINKTALSSLFIDIKSPMNVNTKSAVVRNLCGINRNKMMKCEFCDVKLKEVNISKHNRKCSVKLGMKKNSTKDESLSKRCNAGKCEAEMEIQTEVSADVLVAEESHANITGDANEETEKNNNKSDQFKSLFDWETSPLNVNKLIKCQFCDVKVKEVNLHKHLSKCLVKLGMNKKA